MITDILGDALTRLKNGSERKKRQVEVKRSNLVLAVLEVLKKEAFIDGYESKDGVVVVNLAYEDGEAVATTFERVSKPGQRIYLSAKENRPVLNGRGIAIVSTSEGVMTGAMAKSRKLGGELLCKVW